ncbi:MAG: hypothetical protein H0X02_02880 [Nitrosomonas sp.]|nr:hypothetical protein [Nitrosomonas sp.]
MKTDKQVGTECYSVFNHLQCLIDSHIPAMDYETALMIPENSYQVHTVAFFHNLRLAALENNFVNLLSICYFESKDFEQFKRLTPFMCTASHLLFSQTLSPFHEVEEEKVINFIMRFVATFSTEQNIEELIQFKIIPFMQNFKLHKEEIMHIHPQFQRSANQLLH